MNDPLFLSQKIYLLGINPKNGGIVSAAYSTMDYVLIGTLFLELFQNKNIKFENKKIIILNRKSPIRLHQFLLDKMKNSNKDLRISRWMNKLHSSLKIIRNEVQQELVQKRIIKMEQKRFLFFRWKKPMIINKQEVYHLLSDIENHIYKGTTDEEEIMLLSFLKPAGLLKRIFPEKEKRKHAKNHLNKLMVENQVSIAVADAISAAQTVAASVAATTAAVTAATSS